MYIIGLTGGIGSGKTTVGELFKIKGIDVIDADDLARLVVQKGSEGLQAIIKHFGSDVLLANGELNRAVLRERIFSEPTEKQWLEQLTHPLIAKETQAHLQRATSPYIVYISPLMVELGIPDFVSRLLVVDCPEDIQISRTSKRDNNKPELVKNIMQSQAKRLERNNLADDIILNNGDIQLLQNTIDTLHSHYLDLANKDD